jgi:hypothetical protein
LLAYAEALRSFQSTALARVLLSRSLRQQLALGLALISALVVYLVATLRNRYHPDVLPMPHAVPSPFGGPAIESTPYQRTWAWSPQQSAFATVAGVLVVLEFAATALLYSRTSAMSSHVCEPECHVTHEPLDTGPAQKWWLASLVMLIVLCVGCGCLTVELVLKRAFGESARGIAVLGASVFAQSASSTVTFACEGPATLDLPSSSRVAALSGTLPSELGLLTQLSALNIIGADVSGTIASTVWRSQLHNLSVRNTQISGTLSSDIGSHGSRIGFLDFGDTPLSGTLPAELSQVRRTAAPNPPLLPARY